MGVIKISIVVEEDSFLHIGTTYSPLTGKKAAVFKVDDKPVIPASSFKGALRNQLGILFQKNKSEYEKIFHPLKEDMLFPCIPSSKKTMAEEGLTNYRDKCCCLDIGKNKLVDDLGICPVCYFLGAAGILGFVRIPNFFPEKNEGDIIEQTNIRIDVKTKTAAPGAIVSGEQVKPGTIFKGNIEIIEPIFQGVELGKHRVIGGEVIDKWLERWDESDSSKRKDIILNEILYKGINGINELGGYKSKGGGKVSVSVVK